MDPDTPVTTALDPTAQVLLTIFGGALLTAVAGGIGALIAWNREHHKWIRERRFVAFTDALALLGRVSDLARLSRAATVKGPAASGERAAIAEQATVLRERFAEIAAPFKLLGPDTIDAALNKAAKASDSGDPDVLKVAETELIKAMRSTLRITDA